MKKSRRTYNGVHLNKKSNTQDVVEQSLTECSVIGGQGIKSALDYREVGLYIIPGDSRHILKLP